MSATTTAPPKLKICYVLGSLQYGGAEGQVIELINGLDRDRFEPFLILERDDNSKRAHRLDARVGILHGDSRSVNSTPRRIYSAAISMRRFFGYLSEFRPHVIHAFLPVPCIIGATARLLGKAPCLVASRRSLVESYRPEQHLGSLVDLIATRAADLVLGNSEAVIREVTTLDGINPSRTEVIYNGVDTHRFSPSQSRRLRNELGWTFEHLIFGMIANFLPYKRHADFVRAAAIIKAAIPKARFLLVGEDRGEMGPVKQALQNAGLSDYTKILGHIHNTEVAFAAMDVYVCSSEAEGFSNVVLEAMATGLPVIATDVGGNREAIGENSCGLLVPPHSPELIAKAAVKLVQSPARMRECSLRARHRAEDLFSITRMVRAHEDTYLRIMAKKQDSPWLRVT